MGKYLEIQKQKKKKRQVFLFLFSYYCEHSITTPIINTISSVVDFVLSTNYLQRREEILER